MAISLAVFVQAKDVYPQLLLARLFFSLGGSAAATMVTAVLPTMSFVKTELETAPVDSQPVRPTDVFEGNGHAPSPSISSELTITPARFRTIPPQPTTTTSSTAESQSLMRSSSSQIAGYVGTATGCGALLALLVFLPLPARFQKSGSPPDRALQYSFYIVAVVALLVALFCLVGLRRLKSEEGRKTVAGPAFLLRNFWVALKLGVTNSDITLGYIGGFVARASSVGISLFVPLIINASFLESGLCPSTDVGQPGGLPDIKRRCPQAYVLAAELTGVSQLVALLSAPLFGYASAKLGSIMPLAFSSTAGIIGYPLFATQFEPERHKVVSFLSVCLIGISQIGAIVCSLAVLSGGVLDEAASEDKQHAASSTATTDSISNADGNASEEQTGLLSGLKSENTTRLSDLKGSIAGVYSLYGGAGILILTKLGGFLFDKVSFAAPFYIMATFNAILIAACASVSVLQTYKKKPQTE